MQIIFLEAGIVSALAGIIGYFLGWGAAKVAVRFFSESQSISVSFDLALASVSFAVALLVGLISSSYPALMAARLDPNEALRAL